MLSGISSNGISLSGRDNRDYFEWYQSKYN